MYEEIIKANPDIEIKPVLESGIKLKIPEIAKNPSKILKSKNGYDVMLFKEKEKHYKLVIRTTKNKDENFVKSFHLLRAKRYHQYK